MPKLKINKKIRPRNAGECDTTPCSKCFFNKTEHDGNVCEGPKWERGFRQLGHKTRTMPSIYAAHHQLMEPTVDSINKRVSKLIDKMDAGHTVLMDSMSWLETRVEFLKAENTKLKAAVVAHQKDRAIWKFRLTNLEQGLIKNGWNPKWISKAEAGVRV